jgi:3-isopropylmalate dehydrogenase
MAQSLKVLQRIGEKFGHNFTFQKAAAGGQALDRFGTPLPQDTLDACRDSDAVLLGAVGGPKWDNLEGSKRPEAGLLKMRSELGLFANIRPAVLVDCLKEASPLKPEIVKKGMDVLIVRELTGGIYFGERGRTGEGTQESAFDTERYSVGEVTRIAKVAFRAAEKRKGKVTSVDKANVLESSRLWRTHVSLVAKDFPGVELDHMYVDNAAMQLILDPSRFDVILSTNMFGDILSDEAGILTGSIGMLPSASLGDLTFGLYEPVHGSAPDIAGMDVANPIASILSTAMMLRYSLGCEEEATTIEKAVFDVLEEGYRTKDIQSEGTHLTGTRRMGDLIIRASMRDWEETKPNHSFFASFLGRDLS